MIATEVLWRLKLPDGVVIRCEARAIGNGLTLSAAIGEQLLLTEDFSGRRARAALMRRADEMHAALIARGAVVERRTDH